MKGKTISRPIAAVCSASSRASIQSSSSELLEATPFFLAASRFSGSASYRLLGLVLQRRVPAFLRSGRSCPSDRSSGRSSAFRQSARSDGEIADNDDEHQYRQSADGQCPGEELTIRGASRGYFRPSMVRQCVHDLGSTITEDCRQGQPEKQPHEAGPAAQKPGIFTPERGAVHARTRSRNLGLPEPHRESPAARLARR